MFNTPDKGGSVVIRVRPDLVHMLRVLAWAGRSTMPAAADSVIRPAVKAAFDSLPAGIRANAEEALAATSGRG